MIFSGELKTSMPISQLSQTLSSTQALSSFSKVYNSLFFKVFATYLGCQVQL